MFWAGVAVGVVAWFVFLVGYELWDRWQFKRDWQQDQDPGRFDDERELL